MYMGVIRDEARQAAKKKQREQELLESLKKREIYERVQAVGPGSNTPLS
jgi:protein PET117